MVGLKAELAELLVGEHRVVDADVSASLGEDVNSRENPGESSFLDLAPIGSAKDDNLFTGQITEHRGGLVDAVLGHRHVGLAGSADDGGVRVGP